MGQGCHTPRFFLGILLLATQAADKGTHPSDACSIPAKTYISDQVNTSPMLR